MGVILDKEKMVHESEKRVLVTFGKRTQVISFDKGDEAPRKVLASAKNKFKQFISDFFLKMKVGRNVR